MASPRRPVNKRRAQSLRRRRPMAQTRATVQLISAPSISKTLTPRESHAMTVTTRDFGPGLGLVMVGVVGVVGVVMVVAERRPNELRSKLRAACAGAQGTGPPARDQGRKRSPGGLPLYCGPLCRILNRMVQYTQARLDDSF